MTRSAKASGPYPSCFITSHFFPFSLQPSHLGQLSALTTLYSLLSWGFPASCRAPPFSPWMLVVSLFSALIAFSEKSFLNSQSARECSSHISRVSFLLYPCCFVISHPLAFWLTSPLLHHPQEPVGFPCSRTRSTGVISGQGKWDSQLCLVLLVRHGVITYLVPFIMKSWDQENFLWFYLFVK